jgi:tetratricopeptide (TPR) repeat protein
MMLFIIGILFVSIVIFFVYLMIFYGRQVIIGDAENFYKTGNIEKAIENLKNYKSTRPNDIKARLLLAKIYYEQGNKVESLKEYISVSLNKKATPEEKGDAYAMITKMYLEQKDYNKAIEYVINGLKVNNRNPLLFCYLGMIYGVMGKEAKAIRAFNEALTLDRSHILTRLELAKLHLKTKNKFKARFQLKKVIELDPFNDEAKYELAKIHYEEDELEDAAKLMEQLKEIEGREELYYTVLLKYYIEQDNLERQESIIKKMLELDDIFKAEKPSLLYDLGMIYEKQDEYEKALEYFKLVKEYNPRYKDIESRIQNIIKILNPEEYEKMIDGIDYGILELDDLLDLFKSVIEKLGLKLAYEIEESKDKIMAMAVDQYNPKDKFLVQIMNIDRDITVRDLQLFVEQFEIHKVTNGIFITTKTYNEQAVTYAEALENVELLDKMHLYDLVGELE